MIVDQIDRPLEGADLTRLAHLQQMRAATDTDEYGGQKEGLDHHPDVAELAGTMALVEAQTQGVRELLDDDRGPFVRAQLDGEIFEYD